MADYTPNGWQKKKLMTRYRYEVPEYKNVTYTANVNGGKVNITGFLNELHDIQLNMIDEALEKSDLKEANEVIAYIKGKL